MKKIRNNRNQFEKSKSIKLDENLNVKREDDYPIFCFKYLHKDYSLEQCENHEKIALIEKLCKLSQLTWDQIYKTPRHGLGCEKISRDAIRCGIPPHITSDVTSFIAFRFCSHAPMVGYKNQRIFHIIWLDRDFTLYKH